MYSPTKKEKRVKEKAKKPSVQIESCNQHAPKRSKQIAEVNRYRQVSKLVQVDMDALGSADVCHAAVVSTKIHSTPHTGAATTKDTQEAKNQ